MEKSIAPWPDATKLTVMTVECMEFAAGGSDHERRLAVAAERVSEYPVVAAIDIEHRDLVAPSGVESEGAGVGEFGDSGVTPEDRTVADGRRVVSGGIDRDGCNVVLRVIPAASLRISPCHELRRLPIKASSSDQLVSRS